MGVNELGPTDNPQDTTYALIAITIPSWQWPVWLQCIQIGVVLLTIMVNTGILVAGSDTGIYPDLNPVTLDITEFIGSQGELNADWTTEWFCWIYVR